MEAHMKNTKLTKGIILLSSFALTAIVAINVGSNYSALAFIKRNASPEYKIVLNKDNGATVAEVGTFGDSSSETNLGTRQTNLGNDIQFQFASGRGITNNDSGAPTKFCQMPGSNYGWITNKTALHGITKIKVSVEQTAAVFRFDFSENDTLEKYYYDTQPEYVSYRTTEYTGNKTYEFDFDGTDNYFRFQNLGSSHLSLVSLEVTYTCISNEEPVEDKTEIQMTGSNLVVTNFTDIHVSDASMLSETGTTGKTIRYAIQNSNPDVMLFSGDIVGVASDLDYVLPFLDSFEIPYFFVLGNHDHEGSLNYDSISAKVNASEYGYIEKGPEGLNSQGNYTVKIKNASGTLVHGLVMMDSGNLYTVTDDSLVEYVTSPVNGVRYGSFNGKTTYCNAGWNGIRDNQLTWYENAVDTLNCQTTLVTHMPFIEYCKAYEIYRDAVNRNDTAAIAACEPIGPCTQDEQICGSIENLGLFSSILSKGSTKDVLCGHDHVNDFSLKYQGVRLTYCVKTGSGAYWRDDGTICGYTELTINSTGQTSLNQVFYNPLV